MKTKVKKPIRARGRPRLDKTLDTKRVEMLEIGKKYFISDLIKLWGLKPTYMNRTYITTILRDYIKTNIVMRDYEVDDGGLTQTVYVRVK